MVSNVLGGVNYDAVYGSQDQQTYRNLVESEILKRFLLSMGFPPGSVPTAGIVDSLDPAQISASETTRPFLLTVSTQDVLQVQVGPGVAVTPNGAYVACPGALSFQLTSTLMNSINVLFVENILTTGGTNGTNDYSETLWSQDVQETDTLQSDILANFQNSALYSPTRLQNITVIGVCTVVNSSSNTPALSIDMTRNTYSFVRPWFSVQAVQHQSQIGSGAPSDTNPHGTAFKDLATAGNVTLFQGLSNAGTIVSLDQNVNKMTGAVLCIESIDPSRILTDTFGTVTAKSKYGGINSFYCALSGYPTRLGSCYDTNPADAIAAEVIPGTNILVLGPYELMPVGLVVQYTETAALLPPTTTPTNLLTFGTPATGEAIVSDGTTVENIPNPTIDLSNLGPFARRYGIYVDGVGNIVQFPQVIIPPLILDSIGSSFYQPPVTAAHSGRLRFGLTKANQVPGMAVVLTVYGTDTGGNAVSETITFSTATGYVDQQVPNQNYDLQGQTVLSTNVYSVVKNIVVTSRTQDGPASTLELWIETEPGTSSDVNGYLRVGTVMWNGQGVDSFQDDRLIGRSFNRPVSPMLKSVGETLFDSVRLANFLSGDALINQVSSVMFTEDFEDLRYFDSLQGYFPSLGAVGTIAIQNNNLITDGDNIELTPSKTLTFKTTVPNTSVGQVQIGANTLATLNNILATLQDPTFAPPMTGAIAQGSTSLTLTLTTPLGSAGNAIQLVANVTDGLALTASGFNFGLDAYGEAYLDRGQPGLWSPVLPVDSNLTPSEAFYRKRYRSRAVSIPAGQAPLTQFCIELHEEDKYYGTSVRVRGAETSTDVWTPVQIATPIPFGIKGLYSVQFSVPVHKVQVEIYGRARGVSVLLVRN